jgi:hypothetical protein
MDFQQFLLLAKPPVKANESIHYKTNLIFQTLFMYLDWGSVKNLLRIKLTRFLFFPFVNMETMRLNYDDVLKYSGGRSDRYFEKVQTLVLRDHYSLRRNTIAPSYDFFKVFQNLIILDVNFCQLITDVEMELILSKRSRQFVSLCFMACQGITNRTLQAIADTQRSLKLLAFTVPAVLFQTLLQIFNGNKHLIQVRAPDYLNDDGFALTQIVNQYYPNFSIVTFALPFETAIMEIEDLEFIDQKRYLLAAPVLNVVSRYGKVEILNEQFGLPHYPTLQNNATIFTILILQRDYVTYGRLLKKFTLHPQLPYILHALSIEGDTLLPDLVHFLRIILEMESNQMIEMKARLLGELEQGPKDLLLEETIRSKWMDILPNRLENVLRYQLRLELKSIDDEESRNTRREAFESELESVIKVKMDEALETELRVDMHAAMDAKAERQCYFMRYINFNIPFSIDESTKAYFFGDIDPKECLRTESTLGELCCAKGNYALLKLLIEYDVPLMLPKTKKLISPLSTYFERMNFSLRSKDIQDLARPSALFLSNLFELEQRQIIIQAVLQFVNLYPNDNCWRQLDINGNTLLHKWSRARFKDGKNNGISKIIRHFETFGIGPNTPNKFNETPYYIAVNEHCHALIVAFSGLGIQLKYPLILKDVVELCEKENIEELEYRFGATIFIGSTRILHFSKRRDSVFQKLKDTVVSCSTVHILFDYPKYLILFLKKQPQAINEEIVVMRKGIEVRFTAIEFALHYFMSDVLLEILFAQVNIHSNCNRSFLHRWLEAKFNQHLVPIPGLRSFADINMEKRIYSQDSFVKVVPNPSVGKNQQLVAFTSLLDCLPTQWLSDLLSVCDNFTPIPFFLIHLWRISRETDPPKHLRRIFERDGTGANCLKDRIGNTLLHVAARYSPNELFLGALGNRGFDFKTTNDLGEPPILIYVKSVSLESPMIPRVFEKYQEHPSVVYAEKFDPSTLLSFDMLGRNCFTIALFRDFLRGRQYSNESLLLSTIMSLIDHYRSSDLIHSLVSHFPELSITDVYGNEAFEELDTTRWFMMFKRVADAAIPLNTVKNMSTAFDKIVNQAKIDDKWQHLVADVRDQLDMKTKVEVVPELMIFNQVYSTELHQICANPNDTIFGLIRSHPELTLVADAMNRLPVHIFVQNARVRDESCLSILTAIISGNHSILQVADQFWITPLMYSLMGDCCFGYQTDASAVSQYLLSLPTEHECPEEPESQRNAAFLLLDLILGYEKDEFRPQEGKMYLTPKTLIDILSRWKQYCQLDLELIDVEGGTIVDYWEQQITARELPFNVNGALKAGLAQLGAQTADELFEANQMMDFGTGEDIVMESVIELDLKRGIIAPSPKEILPPMHAKLALPEVKKNTSNLMDSRVQEGFIDWNAKQIAEKINNQTTAKRSRALSPKIANDDNQRHEPMDVLNRHQKRPKRVESAGTGGGDALSNDSDMLMSLRDVVSDTSHEVLMHSFNNDSSSDDDTNILHQEEIIPEEQESLETLTNDLFVAANAGDSLCIGMLQISGANVNVRNEKEQYPIHCWLNNIGGRLEKTPSEFQTMQNLIPKEKVVQVLNHLDNHMCTPLSISIARDVFEWSVANGFYTSSYSVRLPYGFLIQIKPSEITKLLLSYGATLFDVERGGCTPWHGIAMTVYSDCNPPFIPKFTVQENFPLLGIVVAMIVKTLKMVGRLNVNAKDLVGRTGLDILYNRYRNNQVILPKERFAEMIKYLRLFGCRLAKEL